MSMKLVKRVPTGDEIKELYPLSSELKAIKARRDEEIRKIFVGDDDRFIFIIGPCSADNEDAVCDYQNRLAKVADEVKDKILVIPRIYTNKPRTTGDGYKGMLHQPDPTKASDMLEGLYAIRKMHIRAIRETGLTAADEMLEEKERREMYRVTLFHKGDFEAQLDKTKEVLKAAGVYINSIDAESYETETGYWLVPITVEILKEE